MRQWSIGLFVLALTAAAVSFFGVAGRAGAIANAFFIVFLALALLSSVQPRRPST